MVSEARLGSTEHGLVPERGGWFVLNARDARWYEAEGRPAVCRFEGEIGEFTQLGITVEVLRPGDVMAMYHWEADQEDFLVVAGEPLLLVEGEGCPLRQGDLMHCPARTEHVIVAAGDGQCIIVAGGARENSAGDDWGGYTVDEAAIRRGAGVHEETTDEKTAYAGFVRRTPQPYREGWLPGDDG